LTLTADVYDNATYSWYKDGSLLTTTSTNTHDVTNPGVYVVVIEANGCQSLSSDPVTITEAIAKPIIASLSTSLCDGGSVELRVQNSYPVNVSFEWYKDGLPIAGALGTTYYVTEAGDYSVAVNDGEQKSERSEEENITEGVKQPVLQTPPPLGIGGSVTITIQNTADYSAGTSFRWFNNGGPIVGETGLTLTVTAAGQYYVVAVQGSCQSLVSTPVNVSAGS
jgi:hypothetical protein